MTHSFRLEKAVLSIYPEVYRRATSIPADATEMVLWKELSCCILSSQVSYSTAASAAEALNIAAPLFHKEISEPVLEAVLRSPLIVDQRIVRYRFPKSKAHQLAATHAAVHSSANSLALLLDDFSSAEEARRWLVANASGMGPKQSSMFLRNTGMSYDLAIIDRHVIDYMDEVGIGPPLGSGRLSTLEGYSDREGALKSYAHGLGMAVGFMDWAIWIVMRVFRSEHSKAATK